MISRVRSLDTALDLMRQRSETISVRAQSNADESFIDTACSTNDALPDSRHRARKGLGDILFPLMRQQVFLGMAASSVPVKPDVPQLKEDLTAAGIRFIYFSPRNMRRSKPVAEKIGLQTDWNCAISLRDLDHEKEDPHRFIR